MPDINELYQQDGPVSLKSLAGALRDQAAQHNTTFGGSDRQLVGSFLSGGGAKQYPKWQEALEGNNFQYVDDLNQMDRAGINSTVATMAQKYGVNPTLIHSVITHESNYNPEAISTLKNGKPGAIGLMQLMPNTAKQLGVDPNDPAQNIEGGTKYLGQLLTKYHGDMTKAVAAYNAGEGAVDKAGGVPDFPETKAYVDKVWDTYKELNGSSQAIAAPLQPTQTTPPPSASPVTMRYATHSQAPPGASLIQKAKNLMLTGSPNQQVTGYQDVDISHPQTVGQGLASGLLVPAAQLSEGVRQADPKALGNLGLMMGGGSLVKALPLVGGLLSRSLAGMFSYQMLKDAYDKVPAIKQAIDTGDYPTAAMHITEAAQSGAFGAHAAGETLGGSKLGGKLASKVGSFVANESSVPKTAAPPSAEAKPSKLSETFNKVLNRPSVAKTAGAAQAGAETVSPEPKPAAGAKGKAKATPKTAAVPEPEPVAEPTISDEELARITQAAEQNTAAEEAPTTAAKPVTATPPASGPRLPAELANATPKYNYGQKQVNPSFSDDTTKAFYIVSDQKKTSARDADYMAYLRQQFPTLDDDAIRMQGRAVRAGIKEQAKAATHGDTITVPVFKPNIPAPITKTTAPPTPASVVKSAPAPAPVSAPTEDALDLIKKRELAKVVKESPSAAGLPEAGTQVTDNDTGEQLTYRGKSGNKHVFADDSGQVAMYDLSDKEFKNTFTPVAPKGEEYQAEIPKPSGGSPGERMANDILGNTILKPTGFDAYPVEVQIRDKAGNTVHTATADSPEGAQALRDSVEEYVNQNSDNLGGVKYQFKGGSGFSPISKYSGDVKKKIASDDIPQMARTDTGRVKLGADVKSLGEILGSSLYSRNPTQVITKELAQNAYDAIRGVPDGKVKVSTNEEGKWVEVSDNGKGMTADDLGTVFTDLGSSGKRSQADASGGFGLAKAAPLMMSDKLELTTVSVDPATGQKMEHVLHTDKNSLLGEGSEVQSRVVPQSTPTGTTVRSYLGDRFNRYEARDFVRGAARSVNAPGSVEGHESWGAESPVPMDAGDIAATKKISSTVIKSKAGSKIADVDIYSSEKPANMKDELFNAQGAIPVEVNNNGIYQFEHSIYLGGDIKIAGLPKRIAIDVKSTVPEGHADYPFSANRESLRGSISTGIEEYIQKKFIEPAKEEYLKFLSEKYESLPTLNTARGPMPLYDAGARLKPEELASLTRNEEFLSLAEAIHGVVEDTLAKIKDSKVIAESGSLPGLGGSVKRVGIVLSPEVHGVYIPRPGTSKSDATVFVNPFSFAKETAPEEISSLVWHTIKHEILHDKIKGHYESFTSAEATLSHAIGRLHESQVLETLDNAYADPRYPDTLRAGVADALRIYNKSRGREAREKDIFGGEKLTPGGPQPPAAGEGSGDQRLPVRRTEPVPIEPAPGKPVSPPYNPKTIGGETDFGSEVMKPGTQPPGEPLVGPPPVNPRRAKQRGSFGFGHAPASAPEPANAPVFYSQLQRAIEQKMPTSASAEQVRGIVTNPLNGVKADELKWTGLDDLLAKGGKLTKQQVLDHLKENAIQVNEVTKQAPTRSNYLVTGVLPQEMDKIPKYASALYQTPGGSNYKELLLTLPGSTYKSTHWDEPNVLAHVRMNDRTTADGKKMLFLEELQSDWHQQSRKYGMIDPQAKTRIADIHKRLDQLSRKAEVAEYTAPSDVAMNTQSRWLQQGEARGPRWKQFLSPEERQEHSDLANELGRLEEHQSRAVPAAPFAKTWHELALKRMLRYASEHGYDKLGWSTGDMQNDRYDLSKQINTLTYNNNHELVAYDKNNHEVMRKQVPPEELPDSIGKEVAQKLLDKEPMMPGKLGVKQLDGVDLKVGGEGMKGFYDKILPEFASKYGKKWGAKAGEAEITIAGERGPTLDQAAHDMWHVGWNELNDTERLAVRRYQERSQKKDKHEKVHSLDITPAMRKSVLQEGQPISKLNAPPPRSEAPPDANPIYAGNMVTIGGRKHMIHTVHPDNSFDAHPMEAANA